MSEAEDVLKTNVVAVYADHATAEQALRVLHEQGFAIDDLSIVGRDLLKTEQSVGFESGGASITAESEEGALYDALIGWCVGGALVVLPGLGPVVVAGPLTAVLAAALARISHRKELRVVGGVR